MMRASASFEREAVQLFDLRKRFFSFSVKREISYLSASGEALMLPISSPGDRRQSSLSKMDIWYSGSEDEDVASVLRISTVTASSG